MQPLLQAGVSLLHGLVVDGVGQRLGGAHEDAEAFGSRDAGIDEIALQHHEVGHQQGDDDHGIFRALRLVDGGGVGQRQFIEFGVLVTDRAAIEEDGERAVFYVDSRMSQMRILSLPHCRHNRPTSLL